MRVAFIKTLRRNVVEDKEHTFIAPLNTKFVNLRIYKFLRYLTSKFISVLALKGMVQYIDPFANERARLVLRLFLNYRDPII